MGFLALKVLHIASVVVFLGNILTGLFWAAHAKRTRDFEIMALTFEGIIRSDRIFTTPGVIGIIASGIAAAAAGGFSLLGTGWILWPIVLLSVSGIIFGLKLAPLQRQLAATARSAVNSGQSFEQYEFLYKKWELWGLLAVATPVLALVIMVLKPSLPAL